MTKKLTLKNADPKVLSNGLYGDFILAFLSREKRYYSTVDIGEALDSVFGAEKKLRYTTLFLVLKRLSKKKLITIENNPSIHPRYRNTKCKMTKLGRDIVVLQRSIQNMECLPST